MIPFAVVGFGLMALFAIVHIACLIYVTKYLTDEELQQYYENVNTRSYSAMDQNYPYGNGIGPFPFIH